MFFQKVVLWSMVVLMGMLFTPKIEAKSAGFSDEVYLRMVCEPVKRTVNMLPDFKKIRGRKIEETSEFIVYRARRRIPGARICRIFWFKRSGNWRYACEAGIECHEMNEKHMSGSRVIQRCLGSEWRYVTEKGRVPGLRYWQGTRAFKHQNHVLFWQWENDAGICGVGIDIWKQ